MLIAMSLMLASCAGEKDSSKNDTQTNSDVLEASESKIDIEKIKQRLCNEFPKELVLSYNPGGTHIDIETVDNGSGGILHCNAKLFYGKKEHEYWKGQVSAHINQMLDPFWQYSPERNATLYHKVEGLGDKAVYISNMYQLQILKEGVLYTITPPYHGNTTTSGKENKAIALEIAKHYNL